MTKSERVNWQSCGIYVHVPFCLRKCSYCDFVSYPLDEKEAELYSEALCREINLYGTFNERVFSTFYLGGGTPSCLSIEQLSGIVGAVRNTFDFAENAEFTIEVNPGTVNREKLVGLHRLGFNRLSIGVQSFDSGVLQTLGRIHTVDESMQAICDARAAGFDNINIDLIYGVPGLSVKMWRETLQKATVLGVEHVSAYGLQLEKGTPLFAKVQSGALSACPEEQELDMYFATIQLLEGNGYKHYEISNFARPGRKARHNLIYWHNGSYLGFGPAAHSSWEGYRTGNETSLRKYAKMVAEAAKPIMGTEGIDRETAMSETMFLGLRKIEGVGMGDFRRRFGDTVENVYGDTILKFERLGLLKRENGFLHLTRKALPVSNEVLAEFV